MCSTFSVSTNPCNYGANNARFLHSKSFVTRTRAQGIRAHKCSSDGAIPRPLIKDFIPRTDLRVHEIVERQPQANNLAKQDACRRVEMNLTLLEEAYKRCRNICAEYARTYYLGGNNILFLIGCSPSLACSLFWCAIGVSPFVTEFCHS